MKTKYSISPHIDRNYLVEEIYNLPDDGIYIITIEDFNGSRSKAQNALYWMWLKLISDRIFELTSKAYSDNQMHEFFKEQFLGSETFELEGKTVVCPKSTRKLSIKDFSEYLEKIDHYCSEHFDLLLPTPQDFKKAIS